MANELTKLGNEVSIITVKEGESAEEELDQLVRVYRIDPQIVEPLNFNDGILQMNLRMISKVVQLMQGGKSFDVIHLHDWLVAYAGKIIQEIYPQIGFVATFHATEYGRNAGIHSKLQSYISSVEQELSKISHKIIVNSQFMKEQIRTQFGTDPEKIHLIPNGIEINRFQGVSRSLDFRCAYAEENQKLVLYVGRLVGEKGVYVLMDAIPAVLSKVPDVKFVIAGKGPEMEQLRQKAAALRITDNVMMPGFIPDDDLKSLYKCADVAVFPSYYEPFGIVALEAMVAKVAVVVSNTGGLNQIVENGVNGMKFEAGNSRALADCIVELLLKPELAGRIVEQAYQSLQHAYRWDDIAVRTYEVYAEASSLQHKRYN